jgi:hypothetical protein
MKQLYDVAVIGGGAAGFAAAIACAKKKNGIKIVILEKEVRVAKKLLATGNGRCNFTNTENGSHHYHGKDGLFQAAANCRFDPVSNIAFFRSLGIMAKIEETGKVYPLSLQASAVVDMLRAESERLGIAVLTESIVEKVSSKEGTFTLITSTLPVCAKKVIVATGGMAAPELGGSHRGYDLLTSLGHRLIPIAPSLVKIKTNNRIPNALKGIKVEGLLTLKKESTNEAVGMETGEILFTDYGLSGPPVLQLSRFLCYENAEDFTLEIDFLPSFTKEDLLDLLNERRVILASCSLEYYLTGLVQKKVGQLLLKEALHSKLSREVNRLEDSELEKICHALKGFPLPVVGTLGWKQSQVTAGGIDVGDFNDTTMESRIVSGLYGAGEVLDIDGDCGGYNLQWAVSSGRLAGESAAEALAEA